MRADAVTVLYLKTGRSGFEEVDPAEVERRYGIPPALVPDFIALRGDPSDGLPGAPGIGAKTAADLLQRHGSLEAAIERAIHERPRVTAALTEHVLGQRRRDARPLVDGAIDRRLERAVALEQIGGRLRADPRRAWQAIRRIAAQSDEVGHERGRDPVAALHLGGVDILESSPAHLQEHHRRPGVGALVHVAVAGQDQRPPTRGGLDRRERAEQVIGLDRLDGGAAPPKRVEELNRMIELPLECVGHRRAGGVIRRVQLDAVGRRLRPEADDDRAWVAIADQPQQHVGAAEQRVDRPRVDPLDRVGQREERAVQEERAVDDDQRG